MTRIERIQNLLQAQLCPLSLDIINESHQHNVPKGSETHFKIIIVSDRFCDLNLVKRHQLVYKVLQAELNNGLHALSIQSFTPEEWSQTPVLQQSPACRGGMHNENKTDF